MVTEGNGILTGHVACSAGRQIKYVMALWHTSAHCRGGTTTLSPGAGRPTGERCEGRTLHPGVDTYTAVRHRVTVRPSAAALLRHTRELAGRVLVQGEEPRRLAHKVYSKALARGSLLMPTARSPADLPSPRPVSGNRARLLSARASARRMESGAPRTEACCQ